MQDGEKHGAFEREAMLARPGGVEDDLAAAGLAPQAFEDERRADAAHGARRGGALRERVDDDGLCGKAGAGAQQPLQLPALAQILDPPERGDDPLAHLVAVAMALDDLEISAPARGLLAKIHGGEGSRDSIVVSTGFLMRPGMSIKNRACMALHIFKITDSNQGKSTDYVGRAGSNCRRSARVAHWKVYSLTKD